MVLSANGQTSVWDGSHSTWTNGAGTQESPYLIENAAQLAHLAYIVNNGIDANGDNIVGADTYWKLMTDIDLNGSETFQWTPIGYYNSDDDYYSFGGNFDGNNHTIANLYINTDLWQRIGLFGSVQEATITNLGIVGTSSVTIGLSFESDVYAGGMAGYASNTGFDNCYNTGIVSAYSQYSYSGGIVGYAVGNIVNNCYNTGSVYASYNSGGIFGYVDGMTVTDCYNTGSVSSSYFSGGIAAMCVTNSPISTINNCKNTGDVSSFGISSSYSGGIFGYAAGFAGNIIVNNCNNTGSVYSSSSTYCYSGGIVGYGVNTAITDCYNMGGISAVSSSGYYFSSSGGIGGAVSSTTVNNCYNTGNIYSSDSEHDYASVSGGIIGNVGNTTINNCYNAGTINSDYSGGIGGYDVNTTINNCYNIGTINSDIDVYQGGIAGYSSGGAVNYSYYLVTCGGNNTYGGEVKTEELMKDAGFITLLNQDLATPAWEMDCNPPINNGFPILLWQTCEGSDAVETIENQSIIIYPNPAKDIITIASSELQNETYTVFSISGQALMRGKLQGETTTINVSSLASGIYFIKAGNYAGRFVKQ